MILMSCDAYELPCPCLKLCQSWRLACYSIGASPFLSQLSERAYEADMVQHLVKDARV